MQTAEFNPQDFQSEKQRELDKQLLVKFFIKPVQDVEASEKEGRPIFRDVEYIDIRIPGKKSGGVARPARTTDVDRFPEHYQRFKNRQEQPEEGTPLSEWPPVSRSMVETLAFVNVKTVEQLAGLSDTHCSQVMGGYGLRQKAKDFLEYSGKVKDETEVADLKRENEELKAQMAELQATVSNLASQVSEDGAGGDNVASEPKTKPKKRSPAQKKNPLS